jgi:transcription elongation GreA/GreB family factor
MSKAAELRDVRLPAHLASVHESPHDAGLSDEYIRALGELWELDRLLAESEPTSGRTSDSVVEPGDLVTVEFTAAGRRRRGHGKRSVEQYLLVHPAEAALDQVRISVESPLGQALLGRPVGASVDVDAPIGRYSVKILATADAPEDL